MGLLGLYFPGKQTMDECLYIQHIDYPILFTSVLYMQLFTIDKGIDPSLAFYTVSTLIITLPSGLKNFIAGVHN